MVYTLKIVPIKDFSPEYLEKFVDITREVLKIAFNSMEYTVTKPHYFPLSLLIDSNGGRKFIEGDIVEHVKCGAPYFNEFEFLNNQSKLISQIHGRPFLMYLPVGWDGGFAPGSPDEEDGRGCFVHTKFENFLLSNKYFNNNIAHELGHFFGLYHHSRDDYENQAIARRGIKNPKLIFDETHPSFRGPNTNDACIMDTCYPDDLYVRELKFCKPCRQYLDEKLK